MRVISEQEVLSRRGADGLRVAAVALGCPKNTWDLERALGDSFASGVTLVNRLEDAEVILVNTCSFLQEAIKESDREIATALLHKRPGGAQRVVVAGCYPVYLRDRGLQAPEGVDALLSPQELPQLSALLRTWFPQRLNGSKEENTCRVLTTPRSVAYVKIADGCDMKCAFCLIPSFRGSYRSRPLEEILAEVSELTRAGVGEVNLVSQDSTDYGKDLGTSLEELLEALAKLPGKFWVRVQYLYPAKVRRSLLEIISAHAQRLIPYFDLPIQHISDVVLARMKRGENKLLIRKLFAQIRAVLPDAIFNANVIVGFPGETEEDFAALAAFVEKGDIDRLGVFTYSDLPGMPSQELNGQLPEKVKLARKEKLMLLQQRVSLAKHQELVGKEVEALIDGKRRERGRTLYLGRTYRDAYEVNGLVMIRSEHPLEPGRFCRVRLTDALPYDLVGEYVEV